MINHSEKARNLFEQGYNCAQSVFAAFCDDLGLDMNTALKISSSFGGGIGRLREVCGAASAMFMIAGIKFGYTDPQNDEEKAEHYKLIQSLALKFKELNGSYICRELLGLGEGMDNPRPEARTESYYQTRPCAGLVECAARIIENKIKRKNTEE